LNHEIPPLLLSYQPEDLNALNVVHITGTKGKGSTSAFVERICRGKIQEEQAGLGKVVGEEGKGLELEGFEEDEREWVGGIGKS
jgi:UDP-N-acetylmuramyl tripeptide synthase